MAIGRKTLRTGLAAAAVTALLGTGCGDDEDDGPAKRPAASEQAPDAKRAVTVDIKSFKFRPDPIMVKAGGTVTFVNRDEAPHTAQTDLSSKTSEFETGRLERDDEKTVRLPDAGRFAYFCAFHRFMEGAVEVVE